MMVDSHERYGKDGLWNLNEKVFWEDVGVVIAANRRCMKTVKLLIWGKSNSPLFASLFFSYLCLLTFTRQLLIR